jgi:hypothetical protein
MENEKEKVDYSKMSFMDLALLLEQLNNLEEMVTEDDENE